MVYRTEGRPQPNEYFTDGEGIEREVIQSNIPLYLGSEATVRPTEYNGRMGYRIRAMRPLTPAMIDELKSLSSGFQLAMRDNPSQNIDYGTYRNQAFANAGQRLIYGQDSQRSSSSMSYTYGQPSPYANTSSPYPLSGYLPQRSYSYESSSQTNNLPPTEYGIVDVVIGAGAGYKMTTAELDSGSKGSGMNSISAKFLRQLKSEYNYSPYSVPNLDRIRTAKEDFSPSSCVNLDISLVLPDENGNQKRQAQTTENFYVIDNDNFPNILLGREYMKQQSEKRGKSLLWLEKTGEKKKNEEYERRVRSNNQTREQQALQVARSNDTGYGSGIYSSSGNRSYGGIGSSSGGASSGYSGNNGTYGGADGRNRR